MLRLKKCEPIDLTDSMIVVVVPFSDIRPTIPLDPAVDEVF
jgi:hypothetical protein